MRKAMIVAGVMLALACCTGPGKHGTRGHDVGPAALQVVYLRNRVQAAYLLYVAEVGAPGARGQWVSRSASNAPRRAELRGRYRDFATGVEIEARPVFIRGTKLNADGNSFDLTRGNVLVVHMSPTGSLTVTQLHDRLGPEEGVRTVVTLIKAALPHDARVQALPEGDRKR